MLCRFFLAIHYQCLVLNECVIWLNLPANGGPAIAAPPRNMVINPNPLVSFSRPIKSQIKMDDREMKAALMGKKERRRKFNKTSNDRIIKSKPLK